MNTLPDYIYLHMERVNLYSWSDHRLVEEDVKYVRVEAQTFDKWWAGSFGKIRALEGETLVLHQAGRVPLLAHPGTNRIAKEVARMAWLASMRSMKDILEGEDGQ